MSFEATLGLAKSNHNGPQKSWYGPKVCGNFCVNFMNLKPALLSGQLSWK